MNERPQRILIVEDEPYQAEMLSYNLMKEGFHVMIANNGEEGLLRVREETPDVIVLDWMLPGVSGIEVCRQLRGAQETREIPVIMLTARGEEEDLVRGLEIGADDYVVKPYSPREVLARIKALLRRATSAVAGNQLNFADITVNLEKHKVYRNNSPVHLGPTEYRLLITLMEKPGRVLSRQRLLDRVWGRDVYVEDRTVDVHIGHLRKGLNTNGHPDLIRTVRGSGYAIDDEKV